ncbi:MAG TPA: hypothetical protein VF796_31045 [Humisphaera sp.]
MKGLRIGGLNSQADPAGLLTLLQALGGFVLDHKWSLSAAELWLFPDAPAEQHAYARRASDGVAWLSGAGLLVLAACVTVANWGAFLAFPASAAIEFASPPQSEGEVFPIQHPLAVAEVQAVDGESFEVYSRLPDVCALIRQRFAAVECG